MSWRSPAEKCVNGEYFPICLASILIGRLFITEMFNDTVFVLNSEGVYPKFYLNYGSREGAFPT